MNYQPFSTRKPEERTLMLSMSLHLISTLKGISNEQIIYMRGELWFPIKEKKQHVNTVYTAYKNSRLNLKDFVSRGLQYFCSYMIQYCM